MVVFGHDSAHGRRGVRPAVSQGGDHGVAVPSGGDLCRGRRAVTRARDRRVEHELCVDLDPNACATLAIPTEIFNFDIKPSAAGPKRGFPAGVDLAVVK